MPLSVYLPARDRSVMVRPGDTHHGSGNSRAIDLIASSESAVPENPQRSTLLTAWAVRLEQMRGLHAW